MMMLIGPRHSRGAHDPERHGSGALHEGVLFFTKPGIGGFVDSWPETLVPSASNRSTSEWTLVDSVDSRQGRSEAADGLWNAKADAHNRCPALHGAEWRHDDVYPRRKDELRRGGVVGFRDSWRSDAAAIGIDPPQALGRFGTPLACCDVSVIVGIRWTSPSPS